MVVDSDVEATATARPDRQRLFGRHWNSHHRHDASGVSNSDEATDETPLTAPLHRKLKSRHLQMIAIAGMSKCYY